MGSYIGDGRPRHEDGSLRSGLVMPGSGERAVRESLRSDVDRIGWGIHHVR